MAIDAKCPFCEKPYRLKDELAGKKVTCANQDCRRIFQVMPSPNGKPPLDAEALALQALADEPPAPVEQRTITMQCVVCEHAWSVGWDMQGKNVLCPECKQRQKVPEQKQTKAADWRTGGGGPSLARREQLENVTSARDTAMVSGETLKATGIIDDGVEPVPLKVKLQRAAAVLAILAVIGVGIGYFFNSRSEKSEQREFDDVGKSAESDDFKAMPLHRAILRMARGEYAARQNDAAKLDQAVAQFAAALSDASGAVRSGDRDALLGELALSMLALGGDGADVTDEKKLPWLPQPPASGRAQISVKRAQAEGVQGQIRRVLEALRNGFADFEVRAWTARRLARELAVRGRIEVLKSNTDFGFSEIEMPEVLGQIGLELYRSGQIDAARAIGEGLVPMLSNDAPRPLPPASAQALWKVLEIRGPAIIPEIGSGPVSDATRLMTVAFASAKKDYAAALDAASRPGTAAIRVAALANAAEWAETPGPILDVAEQIVVDLGTKPDPNAAPLNGFQLLRLARAAAQAGHADKAQKFIKAINDAALREYARADALRLSLQVGEKKPVDDAVAEIPADPTAKDFLPGQAWGRYHLARHNAMWDAKLARERVKTWPKPLVAPFGAIGVMLGVLDRSVAP